MGVREKIEEPRYEKPAKWRVLLMIYRFNIGLEWIQTLKIKKYLNYNKLKYYVKYFVKLISLNLTFLSTLYTESLNVIFDINKID